MCRSCFESFIRNGGTKTFVLNLGHRLPLELKQDAGSGSDVIREWIDENINGRPNFRPRRRTCTHSKVVDIR